MDPLYHGTSSIFLESIRLHGLGGRDPIVDRDAVSCLNALKDLACTRLSDSDWWRKESVCIEEMCRQTVTAGGFNFRHGATYLTPSELTAVRYALTNRYGSELLSTCAEIYRQLDATAPDSLRRVADSWPWLPDLLQGPEPTPLLVLAHQVPLSLLCPEGNQSVEVILRQIEELRDLGQDVLQQFNFRIREPLTRGLTFYYIRRTGGHDATPEYRLEQFHVS